MTIRVVTDSTCDLPRDMVEDLGITVIPCYLNIDGKSYLDGVEMTRERFYQELPTYDPFPTTSSPGTGVFVSAYDRLADEGADQVLSIHISARLSGMLNAASAAAQSTSSLKVSIYDSGQLTLGLGLMTAAAARWAKLGHAMEEIIAKLEDMAQRTWSYACVDTLEYLRRGGRVSRLEATLGGLLRLKPLLVQHLGETIPEKVRTTRRMFERVAHHVSQLGSIEQVGLVYTTPSERAQDLLAMVRDLIPHGIEVITGSVTPAIGAHIGPNGAGLTVVSQPSS